MAVLRGWAAMAWVAFISVTAAGCGSGLSKEDADIRCDQEKLALGSFFDEAVYASCEACYMKCGDECVRQSTSPISYTCADDAPSSTSTSTSTE